MSSRRRFIQNVGIALASLIMGRCIPTTTCYAPALPSPSSSAGSSGNSARDRLREAWFKFGWLAEQTRSNADSETMGEDILNRLVEDHRAALDSLVADGDLEAPIAEQVQIAYEAAAYHVWRSNAPITCYEPVIIDFQRTSSDELVMQANVLEQLAQQAELDSNTVTMVRDAIERDIAFLALSQTDAQAFYDRILSEAGNGELLSFDKLEFDRSPESIQAAQFLFDLLLGDDNQ